ncbi:disulfide bond formation protein DsbA [uncultured Sulfitobacter sp.]|uniref:disulfide bond formation protein DsbA n=1 Tax=uncultured Sulfitobacter sp. TaxID=191468 RepID=UPI0025956426|nr:disulfide bond formation protein DsbA [uncultured Sulfitobacter sp.]
MRLALACCVAAFPVAAQTDFGALTHAERRALGEEVRALLLAEPELAAPAVAPRNYAAEAYQEKAQADLALISSLTDQVLAGAPIALFTGDDCADCDRALAELEAITDAYAITFTHHMMSDPASAALAAQLGMTDPPFYVMADRILRGHMPDIVLRRYLAP